jgi:pimeloyl-ACP methyl ester carboxylesterase
MDTTISKDGTRIAFDRSGAGPALVVVGGALTTRAVFSPLSRLLEPHFTVLAYDRRGRGDSGDTHPYTVEREVEDLHAVIAAAGGRALVFGHSSGASLALEAAALGLPIARLAVYEPPLIVDRGRPPLPDDYVPRLRELVAAGRRGEALSLYFTVALGLPVDAIDQMRAGRAWTAWEALAHTLAYDGAIVQARTSGGRLDAAWLASVVMPTLVLAGGRSADWMRAAMEALAEAMPGGTIRVLEGQDHGAAPEVLHPVLVDFLLS